MNQIKRHDPDAENAKVREGRLAKSIERNLAKATDYPGMLKLTQQNALLRTCFRLLRSDGEVCRVPRRACSCRCRWQCLLRRCKVPSGEEFQFTVRERMTLKATGSTSDHEVVVWLESLWACLISRNEPATDELCKFPVNSLRTIDGTYAPFVYSWAEAVLSFCLREDAALSKLNAALSATAPDKVDRDLLNIALQIYYPQMKVLHHLATHNVDEFNKALAQAVDLHREFWTVDQYRATDPDGYFSLPLTAMAAIAHDIGMAVTVESEYLPARFIIGEGFKRSAVENNRLRQSGQ
ncbi:immunity 49 family protein [Desmospora activa]|uniref:Immunity protein 49 of polymorphic toxin system n=1 Tax=Desmospora activa DSM 45169 TaxID=1121389 RepID=A0A2T4Z9C6_9BACL|nr:immunity 49 family protein [Desmospora activa]PTM58496.1 immunity protein 49 of polymorphic toxin system [Desmospora activa DSM 45169]